MCAVARFRVNCRAQQHHHFGSWMVVAGKWHGVPLKKCRSYLIFRRDQRSSCVIQAFRFCLLRPHAENERSRVIVLDVVTEYVNRGETERSRK